MSAPSPAIPLAPLGLGPLGLAPLAPLGPRQGTVRGGRWNSGPALLLLAILASVLAAPSVQAQTTGSVLGRVVAAGSSQPLSGAAISVVNYTMRGLSSEDGRFIVVGVPPGSHAITVELIGYRTITMADVLVRAGRPAVLEIELASEALELEGVIAEVERVRLIEPEISATHEVVLGTELLELPLDAVAEAIELAPGVSDGHFRGGRIGQETYVIDGLAFKNTLEASSEGPGLELPPTALEEIEVVTGGLGAQYGNALSGVVRYVTRKGNPVRWESRASMRSDHLAPDAVFTGFNALSASTGGPLGFLGRGATLYADVLLQGMRDAEPRARGLTCLKQGDGGADLDAMISSIANAQDTRNLYCPFTDQSAPHQQGEKFLGFVRFDRPIGTANFTTSFLSNRLQQQLYTSEFKYNSEYQLGQRTTGSLLNATLNWVRQGAGTGYQITARVAAVRIDRILGTLDPASFEERSAPLGFGLSRYEFLGEDFIRSPIEDQIASGAPVPGYIEPGGSVGSPFGPAGEGIFFTEGTPEIANWSRSEFIAVDLEAEYLTAARHTLRSGVSSKFHRIQNYERVLAHLPGSSPNFSRFFPRTVTGYAEVQLAAADEFTIRIGGRVEAFQTGLKFSEDRSDFLSPVLDTEWQVAIMPRIGMSGPIPGTNGKTAIRFNFGQVTQPPDFQFFLDTSIGDSLRTDIRRQGNPNLSFERGNAFELGFSQLLGQSLSVSLVGFRKELTNLVTGNLQFADTDQGQFSTGDFGSVKGVELSFRGRWPSFRVRAGWAVQEAKGVVSGALDADGEVDAVGARKEFPLDFDRRYSGNFVFFAGRAAGLSDRSWGFTALTAIKSGNPIIRGLPAVGDTLQPSHLPWTFDMDLRLSKDLGKFPGCSSCTWRVLADVRNALNRDNVIALRRDTRTVAPSVDQILGVVNEGASEQAIPRESPRYSETIDFDGDGLITTDEYFKARRAAALDRFDPSLFFGDAFQFRVGVEVSFR